MKVSIENASKDDLSHLIEIFYLIKFSQDERQEIYGHPLLNEFIKAVMVEYQRMFGDERLQMKRLHRRFSPENMRYVAAIGLSVRRALGRVDGDILDEITMPVVLSDELKAEVFELIDSFDREVE